MIVWYAVRIKLVFISPVIATNALRITSAVKASTLSSLRSELPISDFISHDSNRFSPNVLNDLNGLNSARSLRAIELHNQMPERIDRHRVARLYHGRRRDFFDDRRSADDIVLQEFGPIVYRRLDRSRTFEDHRSNAAAGVCRRCRLSLWNLRKLRFA